MDVHRLYGDRYRQHRRLEPGPRKAAASRLDNLLAAAPAFPAPVHGSVLVRAAVRREVAQRATNKLSHDHLIVFSIEIHCDLRVAQVWVAIEMEGEWRHDFPFDDSLQWARA